MTKKATLKKGKTHWVNGTTFVNGETQTVDAKLFDYLSKHYADKFDLEDEKKQTRKKSTSKKTTKKDDEPKEEVKEEKTEEKDGE